MERNNRKVYTENEGWGSLTGESVQHLYKGSSVELDTPNMT